MTVGEYIGNITQPSTTRWCYKHQVRKNWTPARPWVVQWMSYAFAASTPRAVWWMMDFTTEVLRRACEEEKIFTFEDDREAGMRQKRATSLTLEEALRLMPILHDETDKLIRLFNLDTEQIIVPQRSVHAA